MPNKILEARPGRTEVFFQLLQDIVLLIMGPTAFLQTKRFDTDSSKQVVMAAIAIYAEAALVALIQFVQTIHFWHLWRKRSDLRSYSRRLRGIGLPNFIVPLRAVSTNVQIIPVCNYVWMGIIAVILVCAIGLPSIILGDGRNYFTDGEYVLMIVSMVLLFIIVTGGNILVGFIFLLEALSKGTITIQSEHVRVMLPTLYSCWVLFQSVVLISRIWVYTSSNPSLRALARIYLLPVTVDVAVSSKEHRAGRIDVGKMYINLRQDGDGEATINIEKERESEKVALDQISKIR